MVKVKTWVVCRWFQHPLLHTNYPSYFSVFSEKKEAMDLRLREITLKRLLSLLVWTLLVILKRGISVLIESIESCIFERVEPLPDRNVGRRSGEATLLPPLSDELVFLHIWPRLQQRVNISLLWRLRRVSRAWK